MFMYQPLQMLHEWGLQHKLLLWLLLSHQEVDIDRFSIIHNGVKQLWWLKHSVKLMNPKLPVFPVIEFGLLLKYSLGLQFMIQLMVRPMKRLFSQGIGYKSLNVTEQNILTLDPYLTQIIKVPVCGLLFDGGHGCL